MIGMVRMLLNGWSYLQLRDLRSAAAEKHRVKVRGVRETLQAYNAPSSVVVSYG